MITEAIYWFCKIYFSVAGLYFIYSWYVNDLNTFGWITGIVSVIFLLKHQMVFPETLIDMIKKNPWVAAILNFLFWGLGYLYNYKRKFLGIVLLVSGFIIDAAYFSAAISDGLMIMAYPLTLIGIGFAYDAYKESIEINKRRRK